MKELNVVLVGIGGYGGNYVKELAALGAQGGLHLAGVVDPYAAQAPEYETARSLTGVFCDSVEEFYAQHAADVAVISTPIPLHAHQTIFCMEHGSHVLVEKPIAATAEDALRMIDARSRTGRLLAVGYQWCYDPAMLAFRSDVQTGLFGAVVSMRALVLWPRDTAYYTRGSGWAGKKYDKHGNPIFDSVASNATAHYIENMLWVAGCPLTEVQAVTARANPIETFDTIALQGRIGPGTLTYAASHAAGRADVQNPMFEYVFEKGTVRFGGYGINGSELTVHLTDGGEKRYGVTRTDVGENRINKLWNLISAIRQGAPIACTAEDALLHTRAMESVREVSPEAYVFPEERVVHENGMYWVPGLGDLLRRCYEERALPVFP